MDKWIGTDRQMHQNPLSGQKHVNFSVYFEIFFLCVYVIVYTITFAKSEIIIYTHTIYLLLLIGIFSLTMNTEQ